MLIFLFLLLFCLSFFPFCFFNRYVPDSVICCLKVFAIYYLGVFFESLFSQCGFSSWKGGPFSLKKFSWFGGVEESMGLVNLDD